MRYSVIAVWLLSCGQVVAQTPPSAEAIRKSMQLDAGLRVELVACEPRITSPVHMAFDADGRLWVVEMRDYPNGPGPGQPPSGRIRVLDDKDGDGFFETSTLFADNLLFANGVLPWKDGVIVTAAPNIMHLRDTDGDGKADRRDILYEGFAVQNPQLRVSNPVLGIDGWIYVANGLRGGQIVKHGSKDPPIDLRGYDFRFNLTHDRAEAISGPGQFGNTFNERGHRFVCDNRHHLRHVVLDNRYLKSHPSLAAPPLLHDTSVLEDGPLSSGGKIYPLSKNWTTSSLHEGRFTAACGVHVYLGDLLPKSYRGAAFTCEPTGNLVHGETLSPKGATYESRPFTKGKEFLASPNDWFRPVSLSTGPDGALYVVDMCRAVIEHPEFMPPELKTRPDLTWGKDHGRIWRIVPEKHVRGAMKAKMNTASTAELVDALSAEGEWRRGTAQRLLLERQPEGLTDALRRVVKMGGARASVTAAYLLDQGLLLDDASIRHLLAGPEPIQKEHGLILAEPRLVRDPDILRHSLSLSKDRDARLRFQLAATLAAAAKMDSMNEDRILTALLECGMGNALDEWTWHAIQMAVVPRTPSARVDEERTLDRFLKLLFRKNVENLLAEIGRDKIYEDFGEQAGRHGVLAATIVEAMEKASPRTLSAFLLGLGRGLKSRGISLPTYMERAFPGAHNPARERFQEFVAAVAKRSTDVSQPSAVRVRDLLLLGHVSWNQAVGPLSRVLVSDGEKEVRIAALHAIANHKRPDLARIVVDHWTQLTPALRQEATEVLLRHPDTGLELLQAIADKKIAAHEISSAHSQALLKSKIPAVRGLAEKHLRKNLPGDRQEALKKYRAALDMKGDPLRGREVFKKSCVTCHRVGGVGVDVGPDIADTRTKTLEALLFDILLPNKAIDNNYVQYVATTKSGKTVSGILVNESAASLTFKRAEGQLETVLRADLEEVQSTGVSLMPDGLEKNITVGEMSDLLAYLKNWRYLDGAVPK